MIVHLSPTCLPCLLYSGLPPPCLSLSPIHSGCSGCMLLHLSPTCLSLSPIHSGCSGCMLLRVSPSGSSGPREMFPLPTLDTLGWGCLFLHLSPLVSHFFGLLWITLGRLLVFLLLCSRLDEFTLLSCLSPFLLHLSPLVSACSGYAFTLVSACLFACSLLRHSWPSGFTLSHLSPCSSPFLLHLSPLVPVLVSLASSLVSLLVSLLVSHFG